MIVRIINVYVKPERIEEFKSITVKNHQASLEEEGVLRFDVLQDIDDPGVFVLYEVYRSERAALAHKDTPHYAEWKTAVESMMAQDRKRSEYAAIAPGREESWATA